MQENASVSEVPVLYSWEAEFRSSAVMRMPRDIARYLLMGYRPTYQMGKF